MRGPARDRAGEEVSVDILPRRTTCSRRLELANLWGGGEVASAPKP
jgi:hypothetical protein